MEEKKNNKLLIILLIVFAIVVLALGGYIVYNKLTEEESELGDVEDNSEIFIQIREVIERELYVLYESKNINDIKAKQKVRLAIDLYCDGYIFKCEDKNQNTIDTISERDLEAVYVNSSLGDIPFENANLPCMLNLTNPDHYAWTYNSNTKTYKYTETGHGTTSFVPVYKELVDFDATDEVYTVSYRYLWTAIGSDGPANFDMYATYEDAVNRKNSLGTIEYNFQGENHLDEEKVREFYENNTNMHDKLDIYTYSFKYENDKVKLIGFTRK